LEFVQQARDAGANDYLIKPFSPRTLMEHMVAVLRNPKEFVAALDYTGPDRRLASRQADFAGEDRRDALSSAEQDAVAERYEAETK
jgi:DNA-binding response OmpR family regulator